ncbi:MAG: polyribonucleotide nucleotidyltransferase [Pseudomonadota bacterium]
MFDIHKESIEWAGRTLTFETGKVARQADGAVMATYGDTTLLATAVAAKSMRPDQDFFPLSVFYQEKFYAAGRIPGGYLKREARPSEHETLTSRLIDRPIRPLFAKGFMNETQIMCTVMAYDQESTPDILALVATSAALTISGVPFMGPIGAARVGYIDGEFILNPTPEQIEVSDLDLIVAGTREGVLMVESEANELPEDVMLDAVMFGWKGSQPVIDMIIDLAQKAAKDPWDLPKPEYDAEKLQADITKLVADDVHKAYELQVKQDRSTALAEAKAKAIEAFTTEDGPVTDQVIASLFKNVESDLVRGQIIKTGNRIDGRTTVDIRPILAEAGILPRVHGSALFTRGETQAIVAATLGTAQDEQRYDSLSGDKSSNFMLHYNFPPYSVGEAGRVMGPGRREIGHGKLAWRAIKAMLPEKEDFPYTLRAVSEITESNGSSSMATVCGTSLAFMDAGVPMKKSVAGIAMGLIKEDDDFAVLSDILGDEDHLGDMDFKVAGTKDGITALQMDIKITSITEEIMRIAVSQAKDGRMHILGEMAKALDTSRGELSQFAPQIHTIKIPVDKIREVIGSGGSVIREITEETGTKIDIEEDGTINVAAVDGDAAKAALDWIKGIVAEPEVGEIYHGTVVRIVDFGAFVNVMGKTDGLVHISEIKNERIGSVTDVLEEGQMVYVKCIDIDNRGRIKLSMKVVDQETGADLSSNNEEQAEAAG